MARFRGNVVGALFVGSILALAVLGGAAASRLTAPVGAGRAVAARLHMHYRVPRFYGRSAPAYSVPKIVPRAPYSDEIKMQREKQVPRSAGPVAG